MKLPIGKSDFKNLIDGNYTIVDKTLFIKDIMDDGAETILITRPRRFGKTLNLSMLGYFLKCHDLQNENIFKGLNISKYEEFCKKHQNQYPVISITLKNTKHSNYTDAYADVVSLIVPSPQLMV